MKFGMDIYVTQPMNHNHFGGPLTFHRASQSCSKLLVLFVEKCQKYAGSSLSNVKIFTSCFYSSYMLVNSVSFGFGII